MFLRGVCFSFGFCNFYFFIFLCVMLCSCMFMFTFVIFFRWWVREVLSSLVLFGVIPLVCQQMILLVNSLNLLMGILYPSIVEWVHQLIRFASIIINWKVNSSSCAANREYSTWTVFDFWINLLGDYWEYEHEVFTQKCACSYDLVMKTLHMASVSFWSNTKPS